MTIFDLFSKRQKISRGDVPDVYSYDKIPKKIKVQIIHIWNDALGNSQQYDEHRQNPSVLYAYKFIAEILCREYGVFVLGEPNVYGNRNYYEELANFILNCTKVNDALDVIELSFKYIDRMTRKYEYLERNKAHETADAAIEELNERFRENSIGFQYINGEIIRVDSEIIHSEVVKPALKLLHSKEYSGAEEEFLKAHKYYRQGKTKDVLSECSKAFESVMKTICKKKSWQHPPKATSKALIQVCLDNNLIPEFWQQHFTSLRSMLESGVPTARNNLGGHGQGAEIIEVPMYIAAFVLHMTASAIVFLTEAEREIE